MVAAAWLAMAFQLNPAICLVASNISLGPLLALWFALEVVVGHQLRHGNLDGLSLDALRSGIATEGAWTTLSPMIGDWLLGALVVMMALGLVVGLLTSLVAAALRRVRNARA